MEVVVFSNVLSDFYPISSSSKSFLKTEKVAIDMWETEFLKHLIIYYKMLIFHHFKSSKIYILYLF